MADRHPQRAAEMVHDIVQSLQGSHRRPLLQQRQDRHLSGTHQTVPHRKRSHQFEDHHGTQHNGFQQLAANRPMLGQLAGQADGNPGLGHQGQADISPFVWTEVAEAGANGCAQPFAQSPGDHIGDTEQADVRQGLDVQIGAGQHEKDDVKQVIDLADITLQPMPARAAVRQGHPQDQARQQRVNLQSATDRNVDGNPAKHQDLVLTRQFETLRPDRHGKAHEGADQDRSPHAHQENAESLSGEDKDMGQDGKTEDRNQVVKTDQGQDQARHRPFRLILANHHQRRRRRGCYGDNAEEQGKLQRGLPQRLSRHNLLQDRQG